MATNLQFIKSASGTSVSSLSVTDCFSANYDVYYVSITKADLTSQSWGIGFRYLDTGGSEVSSAIYDEATLVLKSNTTFGEDKLTNATKQTRFSYFTTASSVGTGVGFYVFNPYDSSSYTFSQGQSSAVGNSGLVGTKVIGVCKQSATHTGLKFLPDSGTYDNITVNVFGVK